MSWHKIYRSLYVKGPAAINEVQCYLDHGSAGVNKKLQKLQTITYVKILAAAIKTLNATPVTLIAAPGANKYTVVDSIFGKCTFVTAAFTGANALEFRQTNGSGDKVAADMPATGFLNVASASAVRTVMGQEAIQTPVANAVICAYVPTADPGGATAAGYLELILISHEINFA